MTWADAFATSTVADRDPMALAHEALGARLNPVYFNPEFNMKEAYSVVTDGGAGVEQGNAASTTAVKVYVKDWQSTYAVDATYPNFPTYTNRTGLKLRSAVATVKFQVPAVSSTLYSKTRAEKTSGTGTSLDPYLFDFTVTNDLLPAAGTYAGLVAVTDEYQIDGIDQLGYLPDEHLKTFTAYQTVPVVVMPPSCPTPTAIAQGNPGTIDSGDTVTFKSDTSTAGGTATLVQYDWDFDGVPPVDYTSTTPDNVDHVYSNLTGSDVVETATLTVRNDCGNIATDTVQITVHSNHAPSARITANPNPANNQQTVDLDSTGTADADAGDTLTYEWDFNYDGTFDAEPGQSGTTAQTSYTNPGASDITKTAGLRVTDNHGAPSSVATIDIVVHPNRAPIANIAANPNPANHLETVNLDSAGSSDADAGDTLTYAWDFDYDGSNFVPEPGQTGTTAQTSYSNLGTLDITKVAALRVTDNHGAPSVVDTVNIIVHPVPSCVKPTARADASTTSQISGLSIDFFAALSEPNAGSWTKYTWDWDINDASPPEEFLPDGGFLSPQPHTYLWAGPGNRNFKARLTVYTEAACFDGTGPGADCTGDSQQCDITVTITPNTLPIANCGASPNPVVAGIPVHFTETGSTDPDPTGSIIKYQWDWDDRDGVNWLTPDYESTTQGGANHSFANTSGIDETFNTTLRVIDNNGTTDTCQVIMTVKPNHAPTAVGSADPNPVQYSGTQVQLIDSASSDPDTGDALTYIWDFDDQDGIDLDPATADYVGTSPDGATFIYTNQGTNPVDFFATLRVKDQAGLTDDDTVVISVGPPPQPPIITYDENKAASVNNAQYVYKTFSNSPSKKDWSVIVAAVNNGGPWDFTNTATWPVSASTKIRRFDLPNETCANDPFGIIADIIYQTQDLNQYEARGHNDNGNHTYYYGL
ncbi:MAG: PKD domain-containing protein, partial [bacterium]